MHCAGHHIFLEGDSEEMRLHFDRVHETVHTRTLANGLRISYLEKPGF